MQHTVRWTFLTEQDKMLALLDANGVIHFESYLDHTRYLPRVIRKIRLRMTVTRMMMATNNQYQVEEKTMRSTRMILMVKSLMMSKTR